MLTNGLEVNLKNLVTKDALQLSNALLRTEIKELRTELHSETAGLRTELHAETGSLRTSLALMEKNLMLFTAKALGGSIAAAGALFGLIVGLMQLFG